MLHHPSRQASSQLSVGGGGPTRRNGLAHWRFYCCISLLPYALRPTTQDLTTSMLLPHRRGDNIDPTSGHLVNCLGPSEDNHWLRTATLTSPTAVVPPALSALMTKGGTTPETIWRNGCRSVKRGMRAAIAKRPSGPLPFPSRAFLLGDINRAALLDHG